MPDFIVSTAFVGKDGITGTIDKMGNSATKFGTKTKSAFGKATSSAKIFKSVLGANLIGRTITSGMMLARRGISSVIDSYVEMDQSIGAAAAKFPGKIKRGSDAFKELEDSARSQAAATKFTASETAAALEFMAKAGFTASQAMALLPGQLELATAGGLDLARSSDIVTDALGAFNLMSKDTAILTENMAFLNDTFAKTMTTANVGIEDLFESMKDGAPVMTAAGQSLESFSALVGVMGSAGIKGGKAGTTLKNMILKLEAPTEAASKKLKKLNIEIEEHGKMRDIIDILDDYSEATGKMGAVQRDATTDLIFGKRAIAGVSVLMMKGTDGLRKYRDELGDAKDAAKDMASEIEKSLGNKIKRLQSAAIELGLKFIDAFKGDGVEGLEAFIKVVQEFDMKPVIAGAKEVVENLKWLFGVVRDNFGLIKGIAKAFIAIKVAMLGFSVVSAVVSMKNFATAALAATKAGGSLAALQAPVMGGAGGVKGAGAKAGGALAAGTAGFALGTILSEEIFDPMFKQATKSVTNIDNLITQTQDRLSGFGGKGFRDPEEIQMQMDKFKRAIQDADAPLFTLEGGIQSVASLFTDTKSPMDEYKERVLAMNEQMRALAEELARAQARVAAGAAQPAQVSVDINDKTAGGVGVEAGGKPAPKVNKNQSGKN